MPKDSPGQIAKLQLNNMGFSGQANKGSGLGMTGTGLSSRKPEFLFQLKCGKCFQNLTYMFKMHI